MICLVHKILPNITHFDQTEVSLAMDTGRPATHSVFIIHSIRKSSQILRVLVPLQYLTSHFLEIAFRWREIGI